MTIDTKELRMLVQEFKLAGSPMLLQTTQMNEILDRLEAAEKNNSAWLYANAPGGWIDNLRIENEALRTNLDDHRALVFDLRKEVEKLRAKIEHMERQEPVAKVESCTNGSYTRHYKLKWLRDVGEGAALYALPGAQTQGDSNVATD